MQNFIKIGQTSAKIS